MEYILRNNKAKSIDFDSTQQIQFWTRLGSSKAGHLLNQYGFNVNIQDNEGYTPLERIVQYELFDLPRVSKLSVEEHIITLLNCGADRSCSRIKKELEENARQIKANHFINLIFNHNK